MLLSVNYQHTLTSISTGKNGLNQPLELSFLKSGKSLLIFTWIQIYRITTMGWLKEGWRGQLHGLEWGDPSDWPPVRPKDPLGLPDDVCWRANGFPSDPDPCVVNMTSEISTETSVAYKKKYRTVGAGRCMKDRRAQPGCTPTPPLYFEQHTQRSSGRAKHNKKTPVNSLQNSPNGYIPHFPLL